LERRHLACKMPDIIRRRAGLVIELEPDAAMRGVLNKAAATSTCFASSLLAF